MPTAPASSSAHRGFWLAAPAARTALVAGLACLACSAPSRTPGQAPGDADFEDLILVEPEVFDLGLAPDFFTRDGRALEGAPWVSACHTQGITIAGDHLVISCVLYDADRPEHRTSAGKSFLLRAPLCRITGCPGLEPGPFEWLVTDITEPVPEPEDARITRELGRERPSAAPDVPERHLMTHPSGLEYDATRRRVWIANTVYEKSSYSHMLAFDPDTLVADPRLVLPVRDHVGAVMSIDHFVLGWTWASQALAVTDTTAGQTVIVPDPRPRTADEHVDIQDCAHWQGTRYLCGGVHPYQVAADAPDVPLAPDHQRDERDILHVRAGRVQILDIDVSPFPDVQVRFLGHLSARLSPRAAPTRDLGVRRYRRDEHGNAQQLARNDYGGYVIDKPLTYEGMALDRERRYIYFLPDDLPAARLIRMRLADRRSLDRP